MAEDKRVLFETQSFGDDGETVVQKVFEDGTVHDLVNGELKNEDKMDAPPVDEDGGEVGVQAEEGVEGDPTAVVVGGETAKAEAGVTTDQESLDAQKEKEAVAANEEAARLEDERKAAEKEADPSEVGFVPGSIEEASAEAQKLAAREGNEGENVEAHGDTKIDLNDPDAPEEELGMTQAEEQSSRAPEEKAAVEEKVQEKLAEKEADDTVKRRASKKKAAE